MYNYCQFGGIYEYVINMDLYEDDHSHLWKELSVQISRDYSGCIELWRGDLRSGWIYYIYVQVIYDEVQDILYVYSSNIW